MPNCDRSTQSTRWFIVAAVLCLAACAPEEEWTGTIEEIDGVTHVSNPAEPLWAIRSHRSGVIG